MPEKSRNNAIQRRLEDSGKKEYFFELDCPDLLFRSRIFSERIGVCGL